MKALFALLLILAFNSHGQETKRENAGRQLPGALLEQFTLRSGQSLEGIWDGPKQQIHVVKLTNHVANVPASPADMLARKTVGDASQVIVYSDVELAEKVVVATLASFKTANARYVTANRNHDALHQFYHGKNLPKAQYDAVMVRYKAADTEVSAALSAQGVTEKAFAKAFESYQKAGGKTAYSLR